jgi:hypothetical protein
MAYHNGYFPLNFGEIDLESTNASGFFSVFDFGGH